ncbi:hypothetical protein LPJ66_009044, partial [Kickxella alabastrina]
HQHQHQLQLQLQLQLQHHQQPAVVGRTKAVSLDHPSLSPSPLFPARNQSLVSPQQQQQQGRASLSTIHSPLPDPPAADAAATNAGDQRLRAATFNVPSRTTSGPRSSIAYPPPRASMSTVPMPVTTATAVADRRPSLATRSRRPSLASSLNPLPPSSSQQQQQQRNNNNTAGSLQLSFEAPPKVNLGEELTVRVYISNHTDTQYTHLCLVDVHAEGGEEDLDHGLMSLDHRTDVPPLWPGESVFVALQYIAAAPLFHSIRTLQLIDADQPLVTIESPFVVYIE